MNMFNGYNQPMYESDPARESTLAKSSHVATSWPYSQNFYHNQENPPAGTAPGGWHPKSPYPGVASKCACAQCMEGPWFHKNSEPLAGNPERMVLGNGGGGGASSGGNTDYGLDGYQRTDVFLRSGGHIPKTYPSYPDASIPNYNSRPVKQMPNTDYPMERNPEQYMRLFGAPPYAPHKLPEQRPKLWESASGPFYPPQQYQYPPSSCRYPPYNPSFYYQGSSSQPQTYQQHQPQHQHQQPQPQPHNGTQAYYGIAPNPVRQMELRQPQIPAGFAKQDSGASKMSPLRLLRKKKLAESVGQLSPPQPLARATEPSADGAPPLDVRRFLSTWADEDDESTQVPQMVVFDCQDINDEQAALLRLYEDATLEDATKIANPLPNVENSQDSLVVVNASACENPQLDHLKKPISPLPASQGETHDAIPTELPTSEYRKNKFLDYDGPTYSSTVSDTPPTESGPNFTETLPPKKTKKRSKKPTIKFSIKKSHDLKISLQVMNDADNVVPEETETRSEPDADSRDSMTLQLEDTSDEHDVRPKRKKVKRKRVTEQLYSVSSEDQYSNIATDGFQVENSLDSAKIKLTFKRKRGERPRDDDDLNQMTKRIKHLTDDDSKHSSFDATSPEEGKAAADTTTDHNGLPPQDAEADLAVYPAIREDEEVEEAKDPLGCDDPLMDVKTTPSNEADSIYPGSKSRSIKNNSNTSSPKITSSCHITSPRRSTDSIERELQAIWNGDDQGGVKNVKKQAEEDEVSSNEPVVDFYTENIPAISDNIPSSPLLNVVDFQDLDDEKPLDLRGAFHSTVVNYEPRVSSENHESKVEKCESDERKNDEKLNSENNLHRTEVCEENVSVVELQPKLEDHVENGGEIENVLSITEEQEPNPTEQQGLNTTVTEFDLNPKLIDEQQSSEIDLNQTEPENFPVKLDETEKTFENTRAEEINETDGFNLNAGMENVLNVKEDPEVFSSEQGLEDVQNQEVEPEDFGSDQGVEINQNREKEPEDFSFSRKLENIQNEGEEPEDFSSDQRVEINQNRGKEPEDFSFSRKLENIQNEGEEPEDFSSDQRVEINQNREKEPEDFSFNQRPEQIRNEIMEPEDFSSNQRLKDVQNDEVEPEDFGSDQTVEINQNREEDPENFSVSRKLENIQNEGEEPEDFSSNQGVDKIQNREKEPEDFSFNQRPEQIQNEIMEPGDFSSNQRLDKVQNREEKPESFSLNICNVEENPENVSYRESSLSESSRMEEVNQNFGDDFVPNVLLIDRLEASPKGLETMSGSPYFEIERKGPRTPAGEPPTPNPYESSWFSSPQSHPSLSPKTFESEPMELLYEYRKGPRTPETEQPFLSPCASLIDVERFSETEIVPEELVIRQGPRTPDEPAIEITEIETVVEEQEEESDSDSDYEVASEELARILVCVACLSPIRSPIRKPEEILINKPDEELPEVQVNNDAAVELLADENANIIVRDLEIEGQEIFEPVVSEPVKSVATAAGEDDELEEGEIVDEYILVEISDDDEVVQAEPVLNVREIPLPPGEAPQENCFDLDKVRENRLKETKLKEPELFRNPSPPAPETPRIQSPSQLTTCVDLKELCCDEDADAVPDDAEFQDVMANCLANAEKFLDRDDVEVPVNDEPISNRDVLLSLLEVTSDFEIAVCASSGDGSLDFPSGYTESLPVDNWPYLEEEVPMSPNWLAKEEDVPLLDDAQKQPDIKIAHPLMPKNLAFSKNLKIRRRTVEAVQMRSKPRGKFASERQCTESDVDLDLVSGKFLTSQKKLPKIAKMEQASLQWQPKVVLNRVADSVELSTPKNDCEKTFRPLKPNNEVKNKTANQKPNAVVKLESHKADKSKSKEKVKTSVEVKIDANLRHKTKPEKNTENRHRLPAKSLEKKTHKNDSVSKEVKKLPPVKRQRESHYASRKSSKREISQSPRPQNSEAFNGTKDGLLNEPWVCEVCGFDDENGRVDHVKLHSFACYYCHVAFKTDACFIKHLEQSHKDLRQLHHCLLCELSFQSSHEHRVHLKTREHLHLEAVERNTINAIFTMLSGKGCPQMGLSETRPEWLPKDPGAVHFYNQPTPLTLAMEYWDQKQNPKPSNDGPNRPL